MDVLVCTIETKRSFLKRKIMENRYTDLFRFIFMLNYFVLLLFFTGVTSAPVNPSIIDIMKNDSKLCLTPKFYDSEYIKPCASAVYPTAFWDHNPKTLNNFLCLGINDTVYKICQYSSQLQMPLNNTAFDSYVKKYVPNENKTTHMEDFCKSLQGFTSLYKTDSLWEQLVKNLNTLNKCMKICFDFDDKFQSLCAVFAWIKSIDDMKSARRIETKYELVVTNISHISQSKDGITTTIGSKNIETKVSKKHNGMLVTDSNTNKDGNSNVSGSAQAAGLKFDEKIKGRTEKANNTQKNINLNNTSETQTHKSILENKENIPTVLGNAEVTKPIKDNPPNSNSQTSMINKVTNINKKIVNEENSEKSKKEQDINTDLKLSTLSENTQDHYDAENPENLENDVAGIKTYLICTYDVLAMFINMYSSICAHV